MLGKLRDFRFAQPRRINLKYIQYLPYILYFFDVTHIMFIDIFVMYCVLLTVRNPKQIVRTRMHVYTHYLKFKTQRRALILITMTH